MYQKRHLLAHHSPNAKGMCRCIRTHTYIYNTCMNMYDAYMYSNKLPCMHLNTPGKTSTYS